MMIVKIEPTDDGLHLVQSQSHRTNCWIDGYIEVPQNLEIEIFECNGFCDLVIENNKLNGIIPRPNPAQPEETEPTPIEQLRADIDYIAIMTGVEL